MQLPRNLLLILGACVGLIAHPREAQASVYLSNLTNRFDNGGLGPIEGVVGWVPIAARFTTGPGSFTLNAVTFEFLVGSKEVPPPPYWTNAAVRLYQERGQDSLLLGSLKYPTLNPLPTQWPRPSGMFPNEYTTFVDFHPEEPMTLHGFSAYRVEVSNPPLNTAGLSLIFSASANYTSQGEWRMGPTTLPFATGANALFAKLAVDADPLPGPSPFIVPDGITAYKRGLGPAQLDLEVIQDPATGDYTCFGFEPLGRETFQFFFCADEGVRAFLVSSNAPITLQSILQDNYPELKLPHAFEAVVPFYVGFYTGHAVFTNGRFVPGIYTNAVFGWGEFVTRDDSIEMLDSALEYGGAGIYAGTQTIITDPESPVLNYSRSGKNLLLWWLMSSSNFVLQQAADLDAANWTPVVPEPALNYADLHYEVTIGGSAGCLFYRLISR